jgi:DNA modification methylase
MQGPPSIRSFAEIPPLADLKFGEVIAIDLSSKTRSLTHGLHRYSAKFIPQIPRWAIREFSSLGDVVLDPFVGSGTTLVEAVVKGRASIGVDIDPLACLISRAKTSRVTASRLRRLGQQLERIDVRRPTLVVPMKGVKNFEHWFSEESWAELQTIRSEISRLKASQEERELLLCIFSSILRVVSNADDQTQKTYVSGTLKKNPPPARSTFFRYLERAAGDIESFSLARSPAEVSVIKGSATKLPLPASSVDLIVTSPPYLDSVDYMYNLMVEYFWLGDRFGIDTRKIFNDARRQPIGTKFPEEKLLPEALSSQIDVPNLPNYRKSSIVSYFAQMQEHFAEASRVLKAGKKYVLVVGNSSTQTGQLPVHDALVRLAAKEGLQLVDAFGYRIRRHYMRFPRKGRGGIILMDWVIVLQKKSGARNRVRRLPMPAVKHSPDAVAH